MFEMKNKLSKNQFFKVLNPPAPRIADAVYEDWKRATTIVAELWRLWNDQAYSNQVNAIRVCLEA